MTICTIGAMYGFHLFNLIPISTGCHLLDNRFKVGLNTIHGHKVVKMCVRHSPVLLIIMIAFIKWSGQ